MEGENNLIDDQIKELRGYNKVLSTNGKRMFGISDAINKEIDKIQFLSNQIEKAKMRKKPKKIEEEEEPVISHTNLAYTLFQPKSSRQIVQDISRRVLEKCNFTSK